MFNILLNYQGLQLKSYFVKDSYNTCTFLKPKLTKITITHRVHAIQNCVFKIITRQYAKSRRGRVNFFHITFKNLKKNGFHLNQQYAPKGVRRNPLIHPKNFFRLHSGSQKHKAST